MQFEYVMFLGSGGGLVLGMGGGARLREVDVRVHEVIVVRLFSIHNLEFFRLLFSVCSYSSRCTRIPRSSLKVKVAQFEDGFAEISFKFYVNLRMIDYN